LAPMNELKRLFKEIDTDMDGWISYKEYFEFLKHFFNYLPSSTIEVLKKYPELIETHTESLGHSELSDTEDQSLEQTLGLLVRNQTIALLNQYATGRAKLYQYNSLPRILK
jgi:Ca2+-binding EF-hand superfamily protein